MDSIILILNSGSSSLKATVMNLNTQDILISCGAEKLNTIGGFISFKISGEKETFELQESNHNTAILELIKKLEQQQLLDKIKAVGHRIVQGGEKLTKSTLITDEIEKEIEKCIPLAPLHNPAHLLGIRIAKKFFNNIPHVAVFDTSFHQTMPEHAYLYAIPKNLYKEHKIRRYGMHGTSYRYVTQATLEYLNKDKKETSLVIAHLGNGSSVVAVKDGESKDTSMGMTPLEGLIMGTRSGSIDPGIFSFLYKNLKMSTDEIDTMLNKESGLLAISELSNDCRIIEEAAKNNNPNAILALEMFSYRLAKYIAYMIVPIGKLDILVFTGGIGENSSLIREKTINHLQFLGIEIDEQKNKETIKGKIGIISKSKKPLVIVVPTNEELMIALDTAELTNL